MAHTLKDDGKTRGAEEAAGFLTTLTEAEVSADLVKEADGLLKTAGQQLGAHDGTLQTSKLIQYFRELFSGTSFQGQQIKKKPDDYYEEYNVERANERSGKVGDKYLSLTAAGYYIWFAPEGKEIYLTIAKVPSNGGYRAR